VALLSWLMAPEAQDEPLTLEEFLHPPEWHQHASCAGLGPAGFVLGRGEGEYNREICEGCAVRQKCLTTALADVSLTGLWGGTKTRECIAMRRARVA